MEKDLTMAEQGHEEGKTFGEDLGSFTVERLNSRMARMKGIIDQNDFAECKAKRMKDAWEALIDVCEILAAGLIIMAKRSTTAAQAGPKSIQDRLWLIAERSPLSAAIIFAAVVILKVFGHGTGVGDITNVITKGGP